MRTRLVAKSAASLLSLVVSVVACGSSGSDLTGPGAGASSSSSGDPSFGPGGTHDCSNPNSGDLQGCSCSQPQRACFTVNPEVHNTNGCKDGVQTCVQGQEFSQWGACTGEVKSCPGATSGGSSGSSGTPTGSSGSSGSSGGPVGSTGGDAGPPPPPNCECYPGAVRWCDAPVSCNWGKQSCKPDGTWGPCAEVSDHPQGCGDFMGFPDPSYDQGCCVQAGQCCQDFEDPNPGNGSDPSVGKCDKIACPGNLAK